MGPVDETLGEGPVSVDEEVFVSSGTCVRPEDSKVGPGVGVPSHGGCERVGTHST